MTTEIRSDAKQRLAKVLRRYLEEQRIKQMELAFRLAVSDSTVSKWVHATDLPGLENMQKLRRLIGAHVVNQSVYKTVREGTEKNINKYDDPMFLPGLIAFILVVFMVVLLILI